MSEKKSPKVSLEPRLVNFFLLGCVLGLTLSLLALDIWAGVKSSSGVSVASEAEPAVEELQMPNTDIDNTPPPPEPEAEPEKDEVVDVILKETEKDVANMFNLVIEIDDDAAIGMDDDEISTETEHIEIVDPPIYMPQVRADFPGGMMELKKYLADNCDYPKDARELGYQGVVLLEFVVEKDGSITQVSVLRSVYKSLDDEAIRVVKSMPKWKAGEHNGAKCRSFFQLPITFSLQ